MEYSDIVATVHPDGTVTFSGASPEKIAKAVYLHQRMRESDNNTQTMAGRVKTQIYAKSIEWATSPMGQRLASFLKANPSFRMQDAIAAWADQPIPSQGEDGRANPDYHQCWRRTRRFIAQYAQYNDLECQVKRVGRGSVYQLAPATA